MLDEAFAVACVYSHSVMEFLFGAGGGGHRLLEQSWLSRLGTRVGWEGAHPQAASRRWVASVEPL